MTLSDLYPYPLVGNVEGAPYDPNKPLKQWAVPAADVPPGTDLDNDLFIGRRAVLASDGLTVTTPQFSMSWRQATTINAPAVGSTSTPGTPVATVPAAPIPIDISKLPAGAKLVGPGPMAAFGQGIQIQLAGAQSGPVDPTLAAVKAELDEVLADVRDEDKRMGGTPE